MYTLNGFVNVTPFADNSVGVIAPIGELSTRSKTYTRELGQYAQNAYKDVILYSFLSTEDDTSIPVPAEIITQALKYGQWLYDRTVVGNASSDRDEILDDLLTAFQAEANSFDCGESVYDEDHHYSLPSWLSWKNNTLDAGNNYIKVYFSDAAFQSQYDKFYIAPVFPFTPVDDFFLAPATVIQKLTTRTNAEFADDIAEVKGFNPETILWGDSFDYVSPLNGSKTPANFNALIYGAAGNNPDSVKEALTTAILAQSTHTREEWLAILPDLFKRTEFILTPIWDTYAIPDREQVTGIYSPIGLISRAASLARQTAEGYLPYHVDQYAQTFGLTYKSLGCVSVGGPENRDDKFLLSDIFPDYIAVGTGDNDYSRMVKHTTDWLYMLAEMLIVAEDMTEFSDVPRGMSRLVRGNTMYVAKSYDKIQYLVVAKKNFL